MVDEQDISERASERSRTALVIPLADGRVEALVHGIQVLAVRHARHDE